MRRNEKGAALVMVLVTFAVLTILAAAFIAVSGSEYKLAAKEENKVKAYYVARSGMNAITTAITKNMFPVPEGLSVYTGAFDGYDNRYYFTSYITKSGITINVETVATVGINTEAKNKSCVRMENTYLKMLEVFRSSSGFTSTDSLTSGVGLPSVIYSEIDPGASDFVDGPQITTSSTFSSINITNPAGLDFDTSGGPININCKALDLDSDIVVNGSGKVSIFVQDSLTIRPGNNIGSSPGFTPNQLVIYIKDGATVDIQPNNFLNCFIYAPNANVSFQPNVTLFGGLVAQSNPGNISFADPGSGRFEYSRFIPINWYD